MTKTLLLKAAGQAGVSSRLLRSPNRQTISLPSSWFQLTTGKMPDVKAGQYISVRVFVKGQELIQPRQYTVVKADAASFTIAVKKVEAAEKSPAGMVSNTLHNDIQEGDLVEVSFPVGEFNLPEGDGSLCLLSAGIGITPLFAMLKEAVKKDPTRKISFVHVCKSKEAVPFSDEIDLLVKEGTVHL